MVSGIAMSLMDVFLSHMHGAYCNVANESILMVLLSIILFIVVHETKTQRVYQVH